MNEQRNSKLTEEEKRKKQYFAELKSKRKKEMKIAATDHSKYMPKKTNMEND